MSGRFERAEVLKAGVVLVCGGALNAAGVRRAPALESAPAPLAELRYSQVTFDPGLLHTQARESSAAVGPR